MDSSIKSPEMVALLDEISMEAFGRVRSLAMAVGDCVKCGGRASDFRDELSRREYGITGYCQKCQDEVFGSDNENE